MLKGYKTLVVNGLLALFAAIEVAASIDIVANDETAITAGVLPHINIFLRVVTNSPVGEADSVSKAEVAYLENEVNDLEDALDLTEVQRDEAELALADLDDA